MKARFIVAAMLLGGMALMSACQKEALKMIPEAVPEVVPQKTIMLTTEGYTEPGVKTKTSVLDNSVQWVDKDYVYITDSRRWVTVSGGKAYIDATGLSAPVCGYHGFGSTTSGYGPGGGLTNWNTTSPTIYAQCQYLAKFTGGRQVMPVPMAAYSETLEESIAFKHLTAAVKVMLRNSTGSTVYVDEVVVKTNTHRINGNITLNLTDSNLGVAASYSSSSEADRKVKVCLAEPLAIPDGNSSYSVQVPILPISGDALTIEVKCHTATNDYLYSKTLSDASDLVTLARNEMLTARLDINPANPTISNRTIVDLSLLTDDYTASDGDVLTGTIPKTGTCCKVNVAAGATVTLRDVSINKDGEWNYDNNGKKKYAGINCQGDATLILEGTNYVRCIDGMSPGIHIATNSTLIIQGDGSLTAYSSIGAGIGSGGYSQACGNIIIAGGNITAYSNPYAAGIGAGMGDTGYGKACGNITITGGTITVSGNGTGIGGTRDGHGATCGNITITGGTITATATEYDNSAIGAGYGNNGNASCGSIIITGGTVTATGYGTGAGIGCSGANANSACGTIDILGGSVTATKGASATYSIGGHPSYCGTVTIGGVENAIVASPYSWPIPASHPEMVVNGKFTINAGGDQVYFSQGNLQYYCSTSTPKWKFAEHQYDFIAYNNAAYSENSGKWIDLFAYGTSGYNIGQDNYQPWKICASGTWYSSNLTGNADWGYNRIENGGDTENSGWRTLTKAEWLYLFQTRASAASKYGFGSVNGTNGIILLPDSWTLPDGLSFTAGTSAWTNSYTAIQWVQMENAGAVFLPASGSCNASAVPSGSAQNSHGFYRSSTNAYYLHFASNTLDLLVTSYPQYGDAVRLVKSAN